MTRNEKSEIISKLETEFKENEAIIVCDYRGLSTKKLEALRDAARVLNVKVQIVKNLDKFHFWLLPLLPEMF